jgi:hypothetical protein
MAGQPRQGDSLPFGDLLWTTSGKVYLVGTPTYDADRLRIGFPDVGAVESLNALITELAWLGRPVLRDELKCRLSVALGPRIDEVR